MIRKWLKCNTSFIELLKNSTVPKNIDQRWSLDNINRQHGSGTSWINPGNDSGLVTRMSTGAFKRPIKFLNTLSDPKERGDGESFNSDEIAVAETAIKTQLFELKGPNGSAFLVEVYVKDLEEVRDALTDIKGEFFKYDKTIIEWFTIKCMLTAEPVKKGNDQSRLARVHAITSGSEDVHEIDGSGKFLFVNNVERAMRAKRILEKLQYKISSILYQFQPKEKVRLEDNLLKVCNDFVKAVEQHPKVISITHNLV